MEIWFYNKHNSEAKKSFLSEEEIVSDIEYCKDHKGHLGFNIYFFEETAS